MRQLRHESGFDLLRGRRCPALRAVRCKDPLRRPYRTTPCPHADQRDAGGTDRSLHRPSRHPLRRVLHGVPTASLRKLQDSRQPWHGRDTEAPALPSRVWVEGQIAEMDEQLATAQKNGKATEDKAYDTVQQAIRQCQDLAEDQIASLVGDELELKRQLDQAEWLESFLEEPVKELPQADFLAAWLQHCRVREELEEFGSFTPARVYTGLRLGGALRVSTAPAVLGSAKSSAQDARAAWKLRA
eukprot:gnl/TRDRNA2_/TRDRNA2_131337_c0_seq3.p1 gnl/TRDRNA2_/TRDRNA2_131337_c0~~gnl/TRDRNA2_/TRDRNA2_131337_c0_seq3.p1  ORF type:complete len:243 (-),score=29.40 gnl/TRDRNA2_/TRDRNA2_131337_c0_seq3:4-732(-)